MTRGPEFSKKVRIAAFQRCEGKCQKCGANLKVGEGEYDHIIPLALTGESTLANCQVLCKVCHRGAGAKTADDVKNISKAKRREEKHIGIKKRTALSQPKLPKPALTKTLPPRALYVEKQP